MPEAKLASQGIVSGFCECGCGERTKISDRTSSAKGWVQGQPRRFVTGHHRRKSPVPYVIDPDTGCWVWQRALSDWGYGQITRKKINRRAHRVYYEQHVGPIPAGAHIHHVCENRRCVNPDHLSPLLPGEHSRLHRPGPEGPRTKPCAGCGKTIQRRPNESRYAFFHRQFCSAQCGRRTRHAKLDPQRVREIRSRVAAGRTQTEVAREFGVSQSRVSDIVRRRTWADVL